MSLLHLISRQPLAGDHMADPLAMVLPDDAVVFMGPAVSILLQHAGAFAPAAGRYYAMADDLDQYGITSSQLPEGVTAIDHQRLLQLVIKNNSCLTW